MVAPVVLAGASRASGRRWAATIVLAVYSVFLLLMLWILPLGPAETKLGPVYRQVSTLIPAEFPLLLIIPAVVLDLLWARTANWNKWLQSLAAGAGFVAVFVAVQWPFAGFLMSPAARNRFFGAIYFDYNLRPSSFYVRHLFLPTEPSAEFLTQIALAILFAAVTTRIGIAWGEWMQRVRR
jgi:hypothetical protein